MTYDDNLRAARRREWTAALLRVALFLVLASALIGLASLAARYTP